MGEVQKHNIEACEHAFEYWKQNATHTPANREACLAIAVELMGLLKIRAPVGAFTALAERCERERIDDIGHGGFGLHSAILAVLSDLGG